MRAHQLKVCLLGRLHDNDPDNFPGNAEVCDGADNDCNGLADYFVSHPTVYLTSAYAAPGVHRYTAETDTWETIADPPDTTRSLLTNDGSVVYLLGQDNVIYAYDPVTEQWSASAVPGPPGGESNQPMGNFQWFDAGFYYCLADTSTLRFYRGGTWFQTALPANCAASGDWDEAGNELYLRTYQQRSFMVVDTLTDNVTRELIDAASVVEFSRTGSFSGGNFYVRSYDGTIRERDGVTGASVDTGALPDSVHTASASDRVTGLIYFAGYQNDGDVFQVFDPTDHSLTRLADSPLVPDHSTLTVLPGPVVTEEDLDGDGFPDACPP